MTSSRTQIDYGQLAEVIREAIARAQFIPNSCILAARLAGIVLRESGVSGVEAMAAELDVFSPAYIEMREQAYLLERKLSEGEVDQYVAKGAWRVTASFGPAPAGFEDRRSGGYHGHVVTLVDREWMIDPTCPAVNRPAKDLIVSAPYAWKIDYEHARTHAHVVRHANGTISAHRLIPGRKDFTKAGDWWRPKPTDEIVARILARLGG